MMRGMDLVEIAKGKPFVNSGAKKVLVSAKLRGRGRRLSEKSAERRYLKQGRTTTKIVRRPAVPTPAPQAPPTRTPASLDTQQQLEHVRGMNASLGRKLVASRAETRQAYDRVNGAVADAQATARKERAMVERHRADLLERRMREKEAATAKPFPSQSAPRPTPAPAEPSDAPVYRRRTLKEARFRGNAQRVAREMGQAHPQVRDPRPPFEAARAEQRARARTEARFSAARQAGEQQRATDAAARTERNRRRTAGAAAAVGGTAAVAGGAVAARRALRHVALRKPVEGMTNSQKALVGAGTGAAGAMLLHERSARR